MGFSFSCRIKNEGLLKVTDSHVHVEVLIAYKRSAI